MQGRDGMLVKFDAAKEESVVLPPPDAKSNICTNTQKGDLLFSGIHNRTFFTGTPDTDTDNLTILRQMDSESVDLIYLDPPFNSRRDYAAPVDSAAGEVGAFFSDMFARDDRWQLMQDEILNVSPPVFSVIHAAGKARDKSARSYLTFMATRLMEMRRILKPTGSIYLHCDPTMSHSLKLLMDAIFGARNFRNEIVWHHPKIGAAGNQFTSSTDTIFFYSKSEEYHFSIVTTGEPNELFNRWKNKVKGLRLYYREAKSIKDSPARSKIRVMEKRLGRTLRDDDVVVDFTAPENQKRVDNCWKITFLKGNAAENTGYPTQKPAALLRRIIEASSKKGDIVLDPFCGCGTACVVAQELGRKWIGIDAACAAGAVLLERGEMEANRDSINWRMIDGDKGLPKRTDGGASALDPKPMVETPVKRDNTKMKAAKPILYGKQKKMCRGCGIRKVVEEMEVDHKRALKHGGNNDLTNLQLLCRDCNGKKGTGTTEALWTKLFTEGRGMSHDGLLFIARKFGGTLGGGKPLV